MDPDSLLNSTVVPLTLKEYKDPFTLWSVGETTQEKNPYVPFYGTMVVTPEQAIVLATMQGMFSQAVIDAVPELKTWLASKPKLTKKG